MHILSRINYSRSADVSSLYFQSNATVTVSNYEGEQAVVCSQGGKISLNSYFNSFYESFYAQYTEIDSLYYLLRLKGDFQVEVYREVCGSDRREILWQQTWANCQLSDCVKIPLPSLQQDTLKGRIYFELECLSEKGIFQEGVIATEQPPTQEVSLAIITCTFKKEAYIKKTVDTILQDSLLQSKPWKIFVVDNGKTLAADDFPDIRVELIPSRNVGGSGGFTTGLVKALQANSYTHFLFMDDDIELDSESIYRLFALYEYAKSDFAVAGSMLDLCKKHVLFEAGALYSKALKTGEVKPFAVTPVKHNLELQNVNNLNSLLLDEDIDYGGFWFFAISKSIVEKVGLPLPLFLKVDDMEFGLRIKQVTGSKLVAFPSIAVWHEPFYLKIPVWDNYYYYRNHLINHAIRGTLGYAEAIRHLTKELVFNLLLFEYSFAEMTVKAFEDYIKGPSFIKCTDPEQLHANILALSKSYKTQSIQHNYSPSDNQNIQHTKAKSWEKAISLLTLNGHLLPNFLTSNDDVFFWQTSDYADQRSRAFAKKRAIIFREESSCLFENEIDKLAGIKLLARWLKFAASSSVRWSAVGQEWKNAYSELISPTFWQQYLEPKNSSQKIAANTVKH